MSVQSELKKFNDKIRADFTVKSELAEKRDVLVKKLGDSKELPSFDVFNQGSYAMCTGIEPGEGKEYDIDVGLVFKENKEDFEPMELKNKIFDVLENHTEYGAKIKKPCVTVTYKKDGEASYHVDLVTYVHEDKDGWSNQLHISKGINSDSDSQKWEKADPKGLVEYINDAVVKGEKRDQFRRVVRYLKKWKIQKFSDVGHVSPPSIGLTLIACDNFNYYENDDLRSLIDVVQVIQSKFVYERTSANERLLYRIKLPLPINLDFEQDSDVFEKMSDVQMTDFKDKIDCLNKDLESVRDEVDELEQYKKLNKIFGDDFDIPEVQNSAKCQTNYIPSSSASGIEK